MPSGCTKFGRYDCERGKPYWLLEAPDDARLGGRRYDRGCGWDG